MDDRNSSPGNASVPCFSMNFLNPTNRCMTYAEFEPLLKAYTFPTPLEWCFVPLYAILFVLGIGGNFLVCLVVWRSKHMRTLTNLFIVNLAVADFFVTAICLPPSMLQNMMETWFLGDLMCKIALFLQTMSVSVSVLSLSAIAVERYYAVCRPLKSRITARKVGVTMVLTWVVGGLVALPNLIYNRMKTTFEGVNNYLTFCDSTWSPKTAYLAYKFIMFLALYLLPMIIIAIFYLFISHHLWSRAVPGTEETGVSKSLCNGHKAATDARLASRRNVAKMLIAIVVLFAVCYLPVHVLFILRVCGAMQIEGAAVPIIFLLSHFLCYVNSAINPVIYNFMSAKFQTEFRAVFSCRPPPRGAFYPTGTLSHRNTRIPSPEAGARDATIHTGVDV